MAKKKTTRSKASSARSARPQPRPTATKSTPPRKSSPPKAAARPVVATAKNRVPVSSKPRPAPVPASRNGRSPAVPPAPVAPPPLPKYSSGLNSKDRDFFRGLLLEKRRELQNDMNTMQAEALSKNRQDAAGDLSSMPIHMADLGSDNYEQEFTLGLIQEERVILREIDEALERLSNGTYGLCIATGKPIGKARLKAQPWARFSYEYMLNQEKNRYRRI